MAHLSSSFGISLFLSNGLDYCIILKFHFGSMAASWYGRQSRGYWPPCYCSFKACAHLTFHHHCKEAASLALSTDKVNSARKTDLAWLDNNINPLSATSGSFGKNIIQLWSFRFTLWVDLINLVTGCLRYQPMPFASNRSWISFLSR